MCFCINSSTRIILCAQMGNKWHRILTFAALACELFGLLTKCRVSWLELEDAGHGVGAHVTLPPAKWFVSTLCNQTQTAYNHNHCKSAWCWGAPNTHQLSGLYWHVTKHKPLQVSMVLVCMSHSPSQVVCINTITKHKPLQDSMVLVRMSHSP